jgi:large subunit ribosomal protein L7A
LPERLHKALSVAVGIKQTLKAVETNQAKVVYYAGDADLPLIESLIEKCRKNNIPVVEVPSLAELGRYCGIDVGASAAAILEEAVN